MSTPTRETLASLLAALHFRQYASEQDLRRDIEAALEDFNIGTGAFESVQAAPPAPASMAGGCEHCGGKVSNYSHGCPGCGAPVCCRRCCDEANAAPVAVQPAPVAWHDIASAPKDGTQVLAYREDWGLFMAMYCSADALASMTDKERDELDEESLFQMDWWGADADGGPWRLEGDEVPTHWMPLPPAPDASPSPAPVAAPVVTDAPQLPEGFRLLPVEATDSMMDAEWNVSMSEAHSNGGVSAAAWRAMVEAAPQVTYGDGHSGVGWYMHDTDYPEEGAVFLSRAILAAQSGAGTRGEQT